MSNLLGRVKVWIDGETIDAADLNAEFDNIINNLTPENTSDISETISEMQETFDPGNLGTENLPQSLAQEVQSLRAMVQKITGEAEWYIPPGVTLNTLTSSVVTSDSNRVEIGKVNGDDFPAYLSFSALQLTLEAVDDDFIYYTQGTQNTLSDNVTTNLTAGPSSNNTATINDAVNTGEPSRVLGEVEGTGINIDSVGSEFVARLNKLVAYKYTYDGDTEIGLATIRQNGAGYVLEEAFRGFFADSSGNYTRAKINDNASITFLRLNYLFLSSTGAIGTTSSDPYIQTSEPASPTINDYWFNPSESKWYIYNGSQFIESQVTLIGYAAVGSTAIEGVRPIEFFSNRAPICDLALSYFSATRVVSMKNAGLVNVNGNIANFKYAKLYFDMGDDLEAGVTEAGNTFYYCYLKPDFTKVISPVKPYDREHDLRGFYHPFKPWRAVAAIFNNASLDIENVSNYGASALIPDNSIGREKIKRPAVIYGDGTTSDDELNFQPSERNILNKLFLTGVQVASGSVSSDKIKFLSSGSMFYLGLVKADFGYNNLGAAVSATLSLKYRKIGASSDETVIIGTCVAAQSGTGAKFTESSGVMGDFIYLEPGQYEAYVTLTEASGGLANIGGDLVAIEI